MKTTATNRKLRVLLSSISDGSLVPRPDFQRRLVWVNKHKNAFIRTVLEGLPFPEIYVAAGEVDETTAKGVELLVDGQQRMTTLEQYFRGSEELKLEKDIRPYVDLLREEKLIFLEYEVVVRDLGAVQVENIKEIFRRINSTSYSLNAMEINNARFDGELKRFCYELAEHPFYECHNIFSANDGRRMNDARFCLALAITILSTYFHRDDLFEEFLEKYNDEFPIREEMNIEITSIMDFIEKCCFEKNSRAYKKADLFTLIIELHRLIYKEERSIAPDEASKVLSSFYQLVDTSESHHLFDPEVADYYKSALQASNDRNNRIRRGKIIRTELLKAVH